jgi:DNA-binding CsgD family transcriptional regulator
MTKQLILPNNHFLIDSATETQKICKPLFDAFNINGFVYAKIYKDGRALPIISERRYLNLHLSHPEFPTIAPIPSEFWRMQSFYFLPGSVQDNQYQKLLQLTRAELKQDHPFYLINRYQDYLEIFVFVAAPDYYQVVNTYLNNMRELKKFCFFFKSETIKLRQEGEQHKIQFPSLTLPDFSVEYQNKDLHQFTQTIEVKNYLLDKFNINLTKREIDCLYYLGKGHSLKGIGQQLDITSRTVETHLNRVKSKLGYPTKAGLIEFISQIADEVWN